MHSDTGPVLSKAPPRKRLTVKPFLYQTVFGTAEVVQEDLLVARNGRGFDLAV